MLYCSIDEAWGRFQNIESFNIKNNIKKNIIENFTDTIKEKKFISPKECKKIMNHIMNCSKCYHKIKNKFRPKILCQLKDIIDDYREIIVLIMIGICIMLFLNLLNNLNNKS